MSEEGRRRREARRRTLSREGLFRRIAAPRLERAVFSRNVERRRARRRVDGGRGDLQNAAAPRLRLVFINTRRGVAVEVRELQEAALVARYQGHGGSCGRCTAAFAVFVLQGGFMRQRCQYRSLSALKLVTSS